MAVETRPENVTNCAFLLGGVTSFIFGLIFLIRQEEALGLLMVGLGLLILLNASFSTEVLINIFAIVLMVQGVAAIVVALRN